MMCIFLCPVVYRNGPERQSFSCVFHFHNEIDYNVKLSIGLILANEFMVRLSFHIMQFWTEHQIFFGIECIYCMNVYWIIKGTLSFLIVQFEQNNIT